MRLYGSGEIRGPVHPSLARTHEQLLHDCPGTNAPTANRRATRRAIRRAALALCALSSAGQNRAERLRRTTIERQPPDDLKHRRRRGGGWVALEGYPPPGEA